MGTLPGWQECSGDLLQQSSSATDLALATLHYSVSACRTYYGRGVRRLHLFIRPVGRLRIPALGVEATKKQDLTTRPLWICRNYSSAHTELNRNHGACDESLAYLLFTLGIHSLLSASACGCAASISYRRRSWTAACIMWVLFEIKGTLQAHVISSTLISLRTTKTWGGSFSG